jgi:hypothetical protein
MVRGNAEQVSLNAGLWLPACGRGWCRCNEAGDGAPSPRASALSQSHGYCDRARDEPGALGASSPFDRQRPLVSEKPVGGDRLSQRLGQETVNVEALILQACSCDAALIVSEECLEHRQQDMGLDTLV